VAGVRPQSSRTMSGATRGPGGRPNCRWRRCVSCRQQKHVNMPVHQFAVRWDDDQTPDVRYAHLADEEAARATNFLIQEFASSGFYSSRVCVLEVKLRRQPSRHAHSKRSNSRETRKLEGVFLASFGKTKFFLENIRLTGFDAPSMLQAREDRTNVHACDQTYGGYPWPRLVAVLITA
jgi:hypothetical protein